MGAKAKEIEEVKHNEHLGDLDEYFAKNERLIHSVCKRYFLTASKNNIDYNDLFQIASIGFIKAYEKFDPSFGFLFSTFGVPKMIGELQRFFRDNSAGGLKISRHIKELYIKILKDDNFSKSAKELMEIYDANKTLVRKTIEYARSKKVQSVDDTVFNDGKGGENVTLAEQLGEEEDTSSIFVKEFLNSLPEREKQICLMSMDGSFTQREIGDTLGVSQVQVSRIIRDKIGPILTKYINGEPIEQMGEKESNKMKNPKGKKGRPANAKDDFSYLDKKGLSKLTTRELLMEGFELKEICFIKGCKPAAVYSMKKTIRLEEEAKQKEQYEAPIKRLPFDEPIVDIPNLEEVLPMLSSKPVTVTETDSKEPDFELAKIILAEQPDADRVFVSEETGLSLKQVSDMRWRIKTRGQSPAVKPEKKLEFNLHASSNGANKKEVMAEFARIMETITAIGADSMSYYISIQSPADNEKQQ